LADQTTLAIVEENLNEINIHIYRFGKSLDDPSLVFWRPYSVKHGEWPFILFFKLVAGKLITDGDLT
jgi:hypothetical protein